MQSTGLSLRVFPGADSLEGWRVKINGERKLGADTLRHTTRAQQLLQVDYGGESFVSCGEGRSQWRYIRYGPPALGRNDGDLK